MSMTYDNRVNSGTLA